TVRLVPAAIRRGGTHFHRSQECRAHPKIRKSAVKPFLLAIVLWTMAATALASDLRYGAAPADLDDHLARLKAAYPEVIKDYDRSRLLLSSGVTIPVSDGRTDKTF